MGEPASIAEPDERILAGRHRGHNQYWCNQACLDNDCEFGPCCELPLIKVVPAETLVGAFAELARYAALDAMPDDEDEDSLGYWRELEDAKSKLINLLTGGTDG